MSNKQTATVETIEIKQTWSSSLPALIILLQDGNKEGKAFARQELARMAKIADLYVNEHPEKH